MENISLCLHNKECTACILSIVLCHKSCPAWYCSTILRVWFPQLSLCWYRTLLTIRTYLGRIVQPCTAQKQYLEFRWSSQRLSCEQPEIILCAKSYSCQTQLLLSCSQVRVVLWLSWGFDNNNQVMAGGGVGSPSYPYAGTELW